MKCTLTTISIYMSDEIHRKRLKTKQPIGEYATNTPNTSPVSAFWESSTGALFEE